MISESCRYRRSRRSPLDVRGASSTLRFPPGDHPKNEKCRMAINDAIQMAENFARDVPTSACDSVIRQLMSTQGAWQGEFVREKAIAAIAHAANTAALGMHSLDLRREPKERSIMGPAPEPGPLSHVADITADIAALQAYTAAMDASISVGYADKFVDRAAGDFERLLSLGLGKYPQAGQPIDPAPAGPLGSLWLEEPSGLG